MSGKFVVVGTGRSGTKYMSQLFTHLGVKTGHEQVYSIDGEHEWGGLSGDSSFAVTAFSDYVQDDTYVLHVMRDPLASLRSQLNSFYDPKTNKGFWDFDEKHPEVGLYVAFWKKYCPEIYEEKDAMGRAIRCLSFWTFKTFRRFRGHPNYKITRLEHLDTEIIQSILTHCGVENVIDEEIEAEIELIGTKVNSRGESYFDYLTWGDVNDHPQGHLLRDIKTTFALGDS